MAVVGAYVAEPFLRGDGLPFSDVLSAEWIERAFREENVLFGQDDILSTQIVLRTFLAEDPTVLSFQNF